MSDTYKTMPGWVKLFKPGKPRIVKEYHDHRKNDCDLAETDAKKPFWWQHHWNGQYCGYDVSYYGYHGGFYARPPRGKIYRRLHEGRMRANWRKQMHDMLKLDRESIEDYDVHSYQHKHAALWEMY